jgi:ATP-dependent RNA helicase DeaD
VESEQENVVGGVTRGQNQLHIGHADWRSAATAVSPLLERVKPQESIQLLIITTDAESAAGIAERLATGTAQRGLRLLAATGVRRATRAYRTAQPEILLGDASTLTALLQSATMKLDTLKAVVLAWVDDASESDRSALEMIMAEVPKDAARMILASSVTPEVEALVERYARRARRVGADAGDVAPVSLSFVTVGDAGRTAALRRVLDAMDPESAEVLVQEATSRDAVQTVLRSLGYGSDTDKVRAVETPTSPALLILYEIPESAQALRAMVAPQSRARVVALVTPRQTASLRRLAGGTVAPLALPEAAKRARSREDAVRDELRQVLEDRSVSREVLTLEPLLTDYDPVEIAAAALRLLEAERARAREPHPVDAPKPMTRLYVNVGGVDNVGPGDLIGALTNEVGVAREEIGRVDVRERHSTVEIATPVANSAVSKLTGVVIRGRRVIARIDEGPPADRRDRPRRDRDDARGPRRDDARGPRNARSGGTRGRMGSSGGRPSSPGTRDRR